MKKIIFGALVLLLTACAAPPSEPAVPSPVAITVGPLQQVTPSATAAKASPTALPASPTPLPASSTPLPASSTPLPASSTPFSGTTATPNSSPDDITKESLEEPGEPVIIFHQEGGFAGVDLTWTIYDNGLIMTPDGEELSVDPAAVEEILAIIEQAGFFELVQPKPSNVCCDFFTYTLAITDGDKKNVITYNDGDPNKPAGLAEAVSAVQQLIAQ